MSLQKQSPKSPVQSAPSGLARVKFNDGRTDPTKAPSEAPLVAVVVTLHDGGSYDPLFREYKQESPEGRVSVWECGSAALGAIIEELQGERPRGLGDDPFAELCAEVAAVDPGSVVFNWECCGGCSDAGFVDTPRVMLAVGILLERGYALMFSDFSLKALLGAWTRGLAPGALGRCPLVKLGQFSASFELRFDPAALSECGSAQLERVGELCESGEASVMALGGTIAYTVDSAALVGAPYRTDGAHRGHRLRGSLCRHALLGRSSGRVHMLDRRAPRRRRPCEADLCERRHLSFSPRATGASSYGST